MQSSGWHTDPLSYATVRELARSLDTSEIMATVLARRGLTEPEAASRFLSATGELHDPFLFPEMKNVCERLRSAIAAGELICVHGDYDVDGITATALLVSVLKELGARVDHHLPNRFSEGYGIAASAVEAIAARETKLLVTVDCGITATGSLERAAGLGMEVIVIDHHRPIEGKLPPGAIISPLLCDYPFKELAGVGLAFKTAQALLAEAGDPAAVPPALEKHLDLVALGTIADVVPLLDENRSLVKRGLNRLSRCQRPGLKALMQLGRVEPSKINTGMVAFRLAPRINAAGRLDDPEPALKLLLTEDEEEGRRLAGRLDELNQERQSIENRMLAEAVQQVSRMTEAEQAQHGYVLSSPGWHEGVIGIVASRMVEMHYRPVILIAENESHGKGSGRSIPAFDLHRALVENGHLLASFGGHKAACGLTIELGQLEEFRRQFAASADAVLSGRDDRPRRRIDAVAVGRELTLQLAEELARLEPFGLGNPSVELLATGVRVHSSRATRDGAHLQCQLEIGGTRSGAIGFRKAHLLERLKSAPAWDIAFRLEKNEFNGAASPQLNLQDFIARPQGTPPLSGICRQRCDIDCPERAGSGELTRLLAGGDQLFTALPESEAAPAGLDNRLNDKRDFGAITGQIAQLLAGGESALLLTADVARRRGTLFAELAQPDDEDFKVVLLSSRCSDAYRQDKLALIDQSPPALALADFVTVLAHPELAAAFKHVVFVDPAPTAGTFAAITAATDAWVHLFHCRDEVKFTQKVIEHEFSLRPALTRIYKLLEGSTGRPLDESAERLLLGGGKYLRQPALAARCLKVLEELELVSIDIDSEKPMLTMLKARPARLEDSPTYSRSQSFYEECLTFLNRSPNVRMI